MKTLYKLLFALICVGCFPIYARGQFTLSGRVLNERDSSGISSAIVQVCGDEHCKDLISIFVTMEDGSFAEDIGSLPDTMYMRCSHLSFQETVHVWTRETPLRDIFILMQSGQFTLEEVSVNAESTGIKIDGDTIRFNLSVLRQGNEQNITQLLQRLPGLSVDSRGEIRYNGQRVSQIRINGKDVLKNQLRLVDDLLGPKELVEVSLYEGRSDSLSQSDSHFLNLVLATPSIKRLACHIGLASVDRFSLSGSGLWLRETGWNKYAALQANSIKPTAIALENRLRMLDFSLLKLKHEFDWLSPHALELNGEILLPDFFKAFHTDAQFGGNFDSGKRSVGYLVHFNRDLTRHGIQTLSLDIPTSTPVEIRTSFQSKGSLDAGGNFHYRTTNTLIGQIAIYGSLSSTSSSNRSEGHGTYRGLVDTFFSAIDKSIQEGTIVAHIEKNWNNALTAELYQEWNAGGYYSPYQAESKYEIFGIAPLDSDGNSAINGDATYNSWGLVNNLRFSATRNSRRYSIGILSSHHRLSGSGRSRVIVGLPWQGVENQFTRSYTNYFEHKAKIGLVRYQIRAGLRQLRFEQSEAANGRWSTQLSASSQIKLTNRLNISSLLSMQEVGFDEQHYRPFVQVIDHRQYALPLTVPLPFSKQWRINTTATYLNPLSGLTMALAVGVQSTDSTLIQSQQGYGSYRVQFSTFAFRTFDLHCQANANWRRGKNSYGLNIRQYHVAFTPLSSSANARSSYQMRQVRINWSKDWLPFLVTRLSQNMTTNRQVFSEDQRRARFYRGETQYDVQLSIGKRWFLDLRNSIEWTPDLPPRWIPYWNVSHRIDESRWAFFAEGWNFALSKKANLGQSFSFSNADISFNTFERMPMYIAIGAKLMPDKM